MFLTEHIFEKSIYWWITEEYDMDLAEWILMVRNEARREGLEQARKERREGKVITVDEEEKRKLFEELMQSAWKLAKLLIEEELQNPTDLDYLTKTLMVIFDNNKEQVDEMLAKYYYKHQDDTLS